ncbi:uncharacterized protein LOC111887967 [Lactuca sativa]|uniref:uncharacterized protein LOC111887967 n=1 Tax=Lactuca sativa TaxID=4236 RepID=UPI001C689033|nr:uncharacterized protein LOC111887967 [Lactuca sativa]
MEAIMDAHGLWDAIKPPTEVAAKKKTAKEVWDSLKSRYVGAERVQKARLRVLKSEFEALQMKESETIDDYAGKISAMISKFGSAGAILEDEELVRKLFDTVPERFINLVASIEQSCDMESMPFEEAIGHLKAYEDRFRLRKASTQGDNALLLAKAEGSSIHRSPSKQNSTGDRGRGGNNNWGGRGSTRRRGSSHGRGGRWGGDSRQEANNTNKKPQDKRNIKCYECQELGHYASECKGKKQQDQEVNLAADEEEPTLLLVVCGEENSEVVLLNEEKVYPNQFKENNEENIWYLDNGASNHMTGCKALFVELDEKVTGQVRFGDGSRVPIKGKGGLLL